MPVVSMLHQGPSKYVGYHMCIIYVLKLTVEEQNKIYVFMKLCIAMLM